MNEAAFMGIVGRICGKDSRYDAEAYYFLNDALGYTAKMLEKPADGPGKHISGGELLEGVRQHALQEYGPMAMTVLGTWGLKRSEDFGEVVFNLVEAGYLGKTDADRRDDFANGYDFYEAFARPFLPKSAAASAEVEKPPRRRPRRASNSADTA